MTSNSSTDPLSPTTLRVERSGPNDAVARVTLNRPDVRNAFNDTVIGELTAVFEALGQDPSLRAIVLAAEGKAFCAGADLNWMKAMAGYSWDENHADAGRLAHMLWTLYSCPVPVIARVQGIATAAGCQLVAMCDLAVASRDAKFAVSGVNLGLFCSTPSVALSRNLSRKAAFEMLVTGAFIDADEARVKGLVNRVADPDRLDAEVEALVASIVAKPRVAIAMGKALFYRQLEAGIEAAYADAGQTMACNMMDASALEGVQAFIEKRPPRN